MHMDQAGFLVTFHKVQTSLSHTGGFAIRRLGALSP